ncbi:MAG TPA: Holliday junction branch migration protein RuvA [Thermoclostridium sp.]|nr:Holliday junction branch migration protein RuvA [Thermoclostridium sp.]
MISYIKGILQAKGNDFIIVETGGIGYNITVPITVCENIPETGSEVNVHTYLHIREDSWTIYGFISEEELKMFKRLITVSGIGPKVAISLVSSVSPSQFVLAVLTDDLDCLTTAPGIGKKTALRIIFELKDKLKKEQGKEMKGLSLNIEQKTENKYNDAIGALMMLGYSNQDSNKAVSCIYSSEMDLETIIRDALKGMAD